MHLPANTFVDTTLAKIGEKRAAEVRRHDDDGVLEIDRAALAVCEPAVIKQLQQDVEHFRMRFLDFVEQNDGVRPAPDRFGELAGLLVADVAGRRADQPRHGVLLLILGHVDPDHRVLVVEQELGKRARQLGLADTGRAQEDEAAQRPVRILQAGAGAANGVGDGLNRFVLADHPLMQALFHVDELLDLALHQPADRNVGPLADDLGDILLVDFFLEHALSLLRGDRPAAPLRRESAAPARAAGRTAARTPCRSRPPAAPARSRDGAARALP